MTIPLGYAQVTCSYNGTNAPTGADNVFGVELLDALDDPSSVAGKVAAIWTARIMPVLTNDVTLAEIRVKFGPDETGPFGQFSYGVVGGVAANSLAPNTSYLVTKGTALGGRRGKGRMFLPGVNEVNVDDSGDLSSGGISSFNTILANVLADLVAVDIPMVLLHEPATIWVLNEDGQPRRIPVVGVVPSPDEVTSLTMNARVGTQRRRLRR